MTPGYTFVQLPRYFAHRWHEVANTRGYLGFIGGGEPQRALDGRVEEMILRSTESDWLMEMPTDAPAKVPFDRGDRVTVITGVLEKLDGRVEWLTKTTAWVVLRGLFNVGEIKAEVPFGHLRKVGVVGRRQKPLTFLDFPVVRPVGVVPA